MSKNNFKENFERIGAEVSQFIQMPIQEGFEFFDYVRLFKGQSIEFKNSEYTPSQFIKLFLLAGYFYQKELLEACEDKLIDVCSKLDINDLISSLPAVFTITSPKLHQKISKVLTDPLEYRTEGFAELTAEEKKLIYSIDCSDETFNFFENVAQYLTPFLKKLTLKRIEEKHLPLLKKFTVLEELEVKEFEYTSKNVAVLLQMPCLKSMVCDLFVNESKDVENLANIKQLKIGKSDTIQKVKFNFNNVSRMHLCLDVFYLFPSLFKLETRSELNLVDYSAAVLEELVWQNDLASGSLHFLKKLKKLIVNGELIDSYKYDYEEFDNLENPTEWKLTSVEELTAKMTGGIYSFPNLKKFKLHSISGTSFELSSLIKLEEFEIISSDVISSEIIDSLLKLPKLVDIKINADIDGDNEFFINELVRKPNLKSLACKKISMTADAYQYAKANNITIKFVD